MDGVVGVLKPPGMTSHDVVDVLRRLAGTRRVGHTGTLDPGAAGVLVLLVGRATRIAEFLAVVDKAYRVELTFGVATDTGDAFGTVTAAVAAADLTPERLREVLPQFQGPIEQVPPMVSAVKVGGVRLYQRARRGETVEAAPRRVIIHGLRLLDFWAGPPPRALLDVECSKGTYVRALARDLGEALGTAAHASFMLRRRVGRFALDECHTLESLAALRTDGRLGEVLLSMDDALADLPAVDVPPGQRQAVLEGIPLPLFKVANWQQLPPDRPVRLRHGGTLLALGRIEGGSLRPFKVLAGS